MNFDGPCGDPTCYRGAVGGWNHQFADGPCNAADCQWPKDLPARPHFTDNAWKLYHDAAGKWWFGP